VISRVGLVALNQARSWCRRPDPRGLSDPDENGQWLPIQIAPDECDLELGRLHETGVLPRTFPCRRRSGVWFNVWAGEAVPISPSHWRIWRSGR
jgi:hypothetical protein